MHKVLLVKAFFLKDLYFPLNLNIIKLHVEINKRQRSVTAFSDLLIKTEIMSAPFS